MGTGTYERYASATALVARAKAADPALTDGRAIFARLAEPQVKAVVRAWLAEVAAGLISLNHLLNPEALVLGGGVMEQPWVLEQLQALCAPNTNPAFGSSGCWRRSWATGRAAGRGLACAAGRPGMLNRGGQGTCASPALLPRCSGGPARAAGAFEKVLMAGQ